MVAVASRTAWLAALLLLFAGCSATLHSGEPSDARPRGDAALVDATSADGVPSRDGTPSDGTPSDSAPRDGTPSDGTSRPDGGLQPLAIDPSNPRYFTGLDGKPATTLSTRPART